jgi:hypothetical protein
VTKLALLAAVLIACGGGDKKKPTTPKGGGDTTTGDTTDTAAPDGKPAPSNKPLYDRLGGAKAVQAVVECQLRARSQLCNAVVRGTSGDTQLAESKTDSGEAIRADRFVFE